MAGLMPRLVINGVEVSGVIGWRLTTMYSFKTYPEECRIEVADGGLDALIEKEAKDRLLAAMFQPPSTDFRQDRIEELEARNAGLSAQLEKAWTELARLKAAAKLVAEYVDHWNSTIGGCQFYNFGPIKAVREDELRQFAEAFK